MPFPPNRRLVLAGADGSLGAYSVSSASVGVSNAAGSGISTLQRGWFGQTEGGGGRRRSQLTPPACCHRIGVMRPRFHAVRIVWSEL